MIRSIALALFLASLGAATAFAQLPSVQGQMPGTLPPAPPVIAPPPPVAPAPVPSAVTPLPLPSFGVPPGVTSPVIDSSSPIYIAPPYHPGKKKRRPRKPNPRVGDSLLIRMI
jgi:hypothetical protein